MEFKAQNRAAVPDGESTTTLGYAEALQLGVRLHREGRLSEAEGIYRKLLEQVRDADVLQLLGLLSYHLGKSNDAVALLSEALRVDPDHSAALNNLGNVLKELGRLTEAESIFRRLLAVQPECASALNNLGVVLKALGRLEAAAAACQRATECQPQLADAWHNLGNILVALGRHDEAISAFQWALGLSPESGVTKLQLGHTYLHLGRAAEAEQAFRDAARFGSESAAAWYELATFARRQGDVDMAVLAYQRTIERDGDHHNAHHYLAAILEASGRRQEAIDIWSRWLAQSPDHPVPRHMLAAASGEGVPARAPDDFVRTCFDGFADRFDESLAHLDYRAPNLVGEVVAALPGSQNGTWEVLDAGCGTGWCAAQLRPCAHRLVGIDLSAGMLTRARSREVYNELIEGELTAWMAARQSMFDLIVSSDTLNYFGDLQPPFAAAAGALRPGGWLVFTLEARVEPMDADYHLHGRGRYCHHEDYVRRVLELAGFQVHEVRRDTLRMEAGQPVTGLIVAAQNAGAGNTDHGVGA